MSIETYPTVVMYFTPQDCGQILINRYQPIVDRLQQKYDDRCSTVSDTSGFQMAKKSFCDSLEHSLPNLRQAILFLKQANEETVALEENGKKWHGHIYTQRCGWLARDCINRSRLLYSMALSAISLGMLDLELGLIRTQITSLSPPQTGKP